MIIAKASVPCGWFIHSQLLSCIWTVHITCTCSEIPQELVRSAKGGEVGVNIEDNRNEEYRARAPKMVAFSGAGHKLGRWVYCNNVQGFLGGGGILPPPPPENCFAPPPPPSFSQFSLEKL